ncbi:aminotransferase class III-fold pyridoxal phosphate-dependent enzyme [Thiotrichales bacterium 19S11-10]|nr:aminotransferase class III-fold pyridoxal phosphate-dependent enzyme [Thiotrichales bacterium 19S11-10]
MKIATEVNYGQELWKKALQVIPGGNGLLSKRPGRYAPDIWPTYYQKASGVCLTDLNGKRYIDMAQMGMGCAILGYADLEVNRAVIDAVNMGVNTTLNCSEEVLLAEKLLELNPFAGGVRFARSGGEAMAMAVRIARAYSMRTKVAFSGYHGWCDWYLATNLSTKDGLSDHLLPGLSTLGVPETLERTIFPFKYNSIDDLRCLFDQEPDIGVIVMEGARYEFPSPDFLSEVQRLASKHKCTVILDEITSGWRLTDGGVYKLNGFSPDIVVYGKAMGNGHAISAILGKKSVMDVAQDTFLSSTFWTERLGFVAALATINVITRECVWEHLQVVGNKIGEGWQTLAEKHDIQIKITDFKPLITFKFQYDQNNLALETLFTQEMLKKGYLAATSVYVSYQHSMKIVDEYLIAVDEVFSILSRALKQGSVEAYLETLVKEEGFKRLN